MRMVFSVKNKKLIAYTALGVAITCWLIGHNASIVSVISVPALWWLLSEHFLEQKQKGISSALATLDVIYAGIRYVGRHAVVIESKMSGNPRSNGRLAIEQLCKTYKGNWFTFTFTMMGATGIPRNCAITPCDERGAKRWLEKFPATYRREFGEPEAA